MDRLKAWGARLFCTDRYEVYDVMIPIGRHYQGKDQTFGVERTNSQQRHWLARFRRLTRDYERLPDTLKGLHFLAFAMLMAHRFVQTIAHCL